MDDFYELYSNDATECIDLQFADEDRQEIGLRIDMQEDFFVITTLLSLDQLLRGENRWYYMEDGVLQRFSSELSEQLHDMLEELREDRQILIHKDDMIRFCTYVIPAIREYVHFEGISLDTFMPYPMEITVISPSACSIITRTAPPRMRLHRMPIPLWSWIISASISKPMQHVWIRIPI